MKEDDAAVTIAPCHYRPSARDALCTDAWLHLRAAKIEAAVGRLQTARRIFEWLDRLVDVAHVDDGLGLALTAGSLDDHNASEGWADLAVGCSMLGGDQREQWAFHVSTAFPLVELGQLAEAREAADLPATSTSTSTSSPTTRRW